MCSSIPNGSPAGLVPAPTTNPTIEVTPIITGITCDDASCGSILFYDLEHVQFHPYNCVAIVLALERMLNRLRRISLPAMIYDDSENILIEMCICTRFHIICYHV